MSDRLSGLLTQSLTLILIEVVPSDRWRFPQTFSMMVQESATCRWIVHSTSHSVSYFVSGHSFAFLFPTIKESWCGNTICKYLVYTRHHATECRGKAFIQRSGQLCLRDSRVPGQPRVTKHPRSCRQDAVCRVTMQGFWAQGSVSLRCFMPVCIITGRQVIGGFNKR